MSDKDLPELVEELRSAISEASSLSEADRVRLDGLASRIEDEADDDDEGILASAEEALARFEVEHIGLVRIINRISDALSAGGL